MIIEINADASGVKLNINLTIPAVKLNRFLFWKIHRNFYELFFILLVQINIIMQHEKAVIKKAVKPYKTKKYGEKESISVNINLGAKSEFNDGDEVAVLPIAEFNKIVNVNVDEIQQLKNDATDKDATIDDLNKSIDKFKADSKEKSDKIASLSKQIKADEKTVVDLKSDISEKDNIISELKSDVKVSGATITDLEKSVADLNAELDETKKVIADNEKTITALTSKNDALHERLDELSDLLTGKDETIASLDADIVDYKIKIAEFNAVDVDKLKDKADELDIVKDDLIVAADKLEKKSNVISLLQNQIMELQQLVNHKDNKIDRLENKGLTDYIFKRDVTADVDSPALYLIDSSGNLIKENPDIDVDATDVADDHVNDNDSGKDRIYKI